MSEREIFEAALEIADSVAREEFLKTACGEDASLLERISGALLAHQDLGSFLESPAMLDTTAEKPGFQHAGLIIGPYKLKERLGAGGMGIVWAAEQRSPIRRRVAIKVIKPGMDSEQVLARFETEREALSLMDHPNIARVLDAGSTAEGHPYFVMELIRGVPITEYCDANKTSVEDRLKIFVRVCRAVQHAHQKGIIHRDIKPQNVLVTEQDGEPIPKVIDFGVAKALNQSLTDRSIYTGVYQAIGTMAYMSPEQAGMSAVDVDSRADVYGLGALLYELLVGTTPLNKQALASVAIDEACRIIREQDPSKPSLSISRLGDRAAAVAASRATSPATLGKQLYGDLDLVIMTALEKDRNRRYDSASSLAEDVRRFLDGQSISVPPPSRVYRLRRFAKRHKGKIAAASIGIASLLLITLVSLVYGKEMERLYDEEALRSVELEEKQSVLQATVTDLELSQRKELELSYGMSTLAASTELNFSNADASIKKLKEAALYAKRLGISPGIEHNLIANLITKTYADFGGATLARVSRYTQFGFSPDSLRFALPVADSAVRVFDLETNGEHRIDLQAPDQPTDLTARVAIFTPDGSKLLVGLHTEDGRGQVRIYNQDYDLDGSIKLTFPASSMAVSPNGEFLVVNGVSSGQLSVYATSDWRFLWEQDAEVYRVDFLDEGKRMVSAQSTSPDDSAHGLLTIWNTSDGAIEQNHDLPPHVSNAYVTPDSLLLITRSKQNPITLDPGTGSLQRGMASSFDDRLFAFSSNAPNLMAQQRSIRSVALYEWGTGSMIGHVEEATDIKRMELSPDGSRLATLSRSGRVKLWDIDALQQSQTRTHPTWALPLVRADEGSEVAMACPTGGIRIWNPKTGRSRFIPTSHGGLVKALAWSHDGTVIASGGVDGTIELRDASSGRLIRPFPLSEDQRHSIYSMAFTASGNQLATGDSQGGIRFWDVESGDEIVALGRNVALGSNGLRRILSLQFDPDGKHLWSSDGASRSGALRRWKLETKNSEVVHQSGWRIDSVKVSPDGKWIAGCTRLGNVVLFSRHGCKLRWKVKAAGSYVAAVAFSEDSSRLFCAALDCLSVLKTDDGSELTRLSTSNSVRQIIVMPKDEGLVTAAANGVVQYWPMTQPMGWTRR